MLRHTLNPDPISPFQFQSNGLQTLDSDGGTTFLAGTSDILTFKESQNNSGIFTNVDDSGVSNLSIDSWNPFDDTQCGKVVVTSHGSGGLVGYGFYDYYTHLRTAIECFYPYQNMNQALFL